MEDVMPHVLIADQAARIRALEAALRWMSQECNWRSENGAEFAIKRLQHSGEQCGIVQYSWGIKPWIFAREALAND